MSFDVGRMRFDDKTQPIIIVRACRELEECPLSLEV